MCFLDMRVSLQGSSAWLPVEVRITLWRPPLLTILCHTPSISRARFPPRITHSLTSAQRISAQSWRSWTGRVKTRQGSPSSRSTLGSATWSAPTSAGPAVTPDLVGLVSVTTRPRCPSSMSWFWSTPRRISSKLISTSRSPLPASISWSSMPRCMITRSHSHSIDNLTSDSPGSATSEVWWVFVSAGVSSQS